MSDKKSVEVSLLDRLAITAEQAIGYAYAGIFPLFLAYLIEPDLLKKFIENIGSTLVMVICLTLGTVIYVLYFKVFGELILFPLQHILHSFFDRFYGKNGCDVTSSVHYLQHLGVPIGYRRSAYQLTKAEFFKGALRRRTHLEHGELHILYLTAVQLILAAIYVYWFAKPQYYAWFAAGIILLVVSIIADTRQHIIECFLLKCRSEELKEFLMKSGHLPKSEEAISTANS